MSLFRGIDTSNYTTSVAVYNSESGQMLQRKQLLPVKQGQLGLRQRDAVFHHTQQLHTLFALSNLWMVRNVVMGLVRPLGA